MIYTLGRAAAYNELIRSGYPRLLGRYGDKPTGYSGGPVWKTKEEALSLCPAGHSVFGVLADWDTDTALPWLAGTHRDLLINAAITRL